MNDTTRDELLKDLIDYAESGKVAEPQWVQRMRELQAALSAQPAASVQSMTAERDAAQARVRELEAFAAFAKCCMQSGEPWSEAAQQMYDKALTGAAR